MIRRDWIRCVYAYFPNSVSVPTVFLTWWKGDQRYAKPVGRRESSHHLEGGGKGGQVCRHPAREGP
jgi:hypothetical protein